MSELTFLLTDVESSTILWERFPAEMSAGLARHVQIIADIVEALGGTLVRQHGEGDSTFSVFETASDGVGAAAAAARALASEPWPKDAPIRVRAAVYTGEAEPRDGDYYGTTVNRAARLRSLAFAGQVLVGASTAELVSSDLPSGAELVDLGPRPLRDLSVPERVFELRLDDLSGPPEPLSDAGASDVAWIERASAETLVGRQRELGSLDDAWRAAVTGERVLALVSGEPGIGKTTLVAHAARRVYDGGGLVLYGGWDEEAIAPFQAFRHALATYARSCPRSILRADLRGHGGDLTRLFPEVADRIEAEAPARSHAEAERYRLFEALESWLEAIASRRPVVLVLDDMHWADRASLLLLQHIVRKPNPSSLLIIATFRDTDLHETELARALPILYRLPHARRIPLEGLEANHVLELFERTTSARMREQTRVVANELHAETAGNPFFLSEILRHLDETGALDNALGHQKRIELPETVRDLVRWRLNRLSDEVFEGLSAASVIGQEFDFEVLVAASGIEESRLLDALDTACRAGLAREHHADRYAFSHAVVRRTLLDDLSWARRLRLHRRIGEALERRGSRVTPAELALHFCAAANLGVSEKAIQYARAAGGQAMDELAFEAAVGHYQRALEVQELHATDDLAIRCELLLALGSAHDKAGEYASRDERFLLAADEARHLDSTDLFTRAALGYGGVLPAAVEPDPRGHALLEEALTRLGGADGRDRALVLSRLAHWLHFAAPRSQRLQIADEAVAIARRLGDGADLASVLTDRVWALDGPDDLTDQLQVADEIARIGRELGASDIVLDAVRARSDALFEKGDIAALHTAVAELTRLATDLRIPEYIRIARAWEAVFAGIDGRFDDARRIAADVHQQLQVMGHPQAESIYFAQLFPISWLSGALADGVEFAEAMMQAQPDRPMWAAVAAWSSAESGQLERARRALDSLSPDAVSAMDKNFIWWPTIVGLTDAVTLLDDAAWAAVLYDVALPYADRLVSIGSSSFLGAAGLHLGQLAATLGRYEAAVEHFESAIAWHERLGARPLLAFTQQAFARMLFARGGLGDLDHARDLQDEAQRTARELGLAAVSARAVAALGV